jgi:hypothetical protein
VYSRLVEVQKLSDGRESLPDEAAEGKPLTIQDTEEKNIVEQVAGEIPMVGMQNKASTGNDIVEQHRTGKAGDQG